MTVFQTNMTDRETEEKPKHKLLTRTTQSASRPPMVKSSSLVSANRRNSLHYLVHSSTTLWSSLDVPEDQGLQQEPVYIKFNIGGTRYELSEATILKRCQFGLLHRFASSSLQKRLELRHRYDELSGEYFFERSGALFQNIYLYYLNGMRIQVPLYLRDHFIEELSHWGLAKLFYPDLITHRQILEARKLSLVEKFKCVRFGRLREQVWHLLDSPESSQFARCFALTCIIAVLLSNIVLVLSSMEQFQVEVHSQNGTLTTIEAHPFLAYLEDICIALFTAEYVTKLVVCADRRAFFYNYMNVIDFIAIAPFYMELAVYYIGLDSSHLENMQGPFLMMHILRVMRVVRLFKLGRHSTGLRVFAKVIWSCLVQLGMVMAVVIITIMFFSTIMYYLEKDVPSTKFKSIPMTFWWCVVTMTTVGYGDMIPFTTGGKMVGICSIVMGFLAVSMPITIFVGRFMNMQKEEEAKRNR